MKQSKFIKHRLPCKSCGSSDAVSLNEDGTAKCFSCDTWYIKYDDNIIGEEVTDTTTVNAHGGLFAPLSDRSISKETAQKYNTDVKVNGNMNTHHIYKYFDES